MANIARRKVVCQARSFRQVALSGKKKCHPAQISLRIRQLQGSGPLETSARCDLDGSHHQISIPSPLHLYNLQYCILPTNIHYPCSGWPYIPDLSRFVKVARDFRKSRDCERLVEQTRQSVLPSNSSLARYPQFAPQPINRLHPASRFSRHYTAESSMNSGSSTTIATATIQRSVVPTNEP